MKKSPKGLRTGHQPTGQSPQNIKPPISGAGAKTPGKNNEEFLDEADKEYLKAQVEGLRARVAEKGAEIERLRKELEQEREICSHEMIDAQALQSEVERLKKRIGYLELQPNRVYADWRQALDEKDERIKDLEAVIERLRDAECPKCGRSLPPDGDCYGCEVDRQAAVIEEVREWGEGKRQIINMSYVIDRDDGEWRERLDGWDELDVILEKARRG